MAMPVEPKLSRPDLAADPSLRISLSAPGVREKRDKSQAELQALLAALDGVHGHDSNKGATSNSQKVPLSEEELHLLRTVVLAAIDLQRPSAIPRRVLDVLKTLLLALEDAKEHVDKLSGTVDSLQGLAVRLGTAYFAFKGLLVTLGVL
jgi:hypothetical protein